MADWLLIRLPRAPDAPASWLVCDGLGRIVVPQQKGTLLQAAPLGGSRRVCVVVPAGDVVLTEVDVPVKSGLKVREVVPFALEEQLAEDIDSLHFAVGKRPAEGARTPVAVVSRALMDGWLAELRDAGISPEVLYAESELIPDNPGQAVAVLDEDCAIVRPAGGTPLTLPMDALAEALTLTCPGSEQMVATERTGSGLVLYTGAAEWHQRARDVEAIRDRFDGIKVQLLTDGPLALLAQRVATAPGSGDVINLLQGPYAPVDSFANTWKEWRVAAVLLVSLLALHAVGSTAELLVLKRSERTVDAAITTTFRAAMPGERNTIDARRRMEQRLATLKGGGSGLLSALDALAQARVGTQGTVLRALNFRESGLDLTLSAPNVEALDHISQNLKAAGWNADLTSGNAVGSQYEGRIQIKPRA
ncbi:MAG TPA: type II secretion system protein GspL [Steroidobacteraceae bacterium]|nr:type II secretion system protein GspL [Steroidobacteraceae bacterium]